MLVNRARAVLVNRARGCESCLGAFGRALLVLLNDVATGIENVSCTLWNADLRGMLCVWHRSKLAPALPSVLQDASAQNAGSSDWRFCGKTRYLEALQPCLAGEPVAIRSLVAQTSSISDHSEAQ